MSHYFSRLAQRSGVNANTPVARHGHSSSNTESNWGEQSVESIAADDATPMTSGNANSQVSDKTFDNPKARGSNPERVITSTPLIAPSLQSNASALIQHKTDDGLIPDATDASHSLDTPSRFTQSSAVDVTETKQSKNNAVFDNEKAITKTVSETAKQDLVYSKRNGLRIDGKAGTSNVDVEPVTAYNDTSFNTIVHSASVKTQASKTDGSNSLGDNDSIAQSPAYSESMLSRQSTVQNGKLDAVKSGPAHTSTPHIQPMRTASNSSIEVNIGKIELEIITPAKKTVSAQPVAPAKVQRSKPAAVFNPHRHYLRGR